MNGLVAKMLFASGAGSFIIACSSLKASPAPTTPFLSHTEELHSWYDHAPWDLVWSADPGKVMVNLPTTRKIWFPKVDTTYLNQKKNKDGQWVIAHKIEDSDATTLADSLRDSIIQEVKSHPETNLEVVDSPTPDSFTIALALTEAIPTNVAVNAVADVGGLFVPGGKVAEQVGVAGVEAASGAVASGSIAFEMKIIDPNSQKIIAEAQDRETDPASVIPNYRDFEKFGWSRKTIAEWATQFREVFSTSATTKVGLEDSISVLPW